MTTAVAMLGGACRAAPNATAARAEPERFVNPIVRQRADPHVFRHDGWYYYTATVPEYDRLELRRARTIQGLADAPATVIWREHAAGAMGAHVWAPEIHRIDGKWYVYFAAGGAEAVWDIRMYVLDSASDDPLRGPNRHTRAQHVRWRTDGTPDFGVPVPGGKPGALSLGSLMIAVLADLGSFALTAGTCSRRRGS